MKIQLQNSKKYKKSKQIANHWSILGKSSSCLIYLLEFAVPARVQKYSTRIEFFKSRTFSRTVPYRTVLDSNIFCRNNIFFLVALSFF
jgi:hypothetical protein